MILESQRTILPNHHTAGRMPLPTSSPGTMPNGRAVSPDQTGRFTPPRRLSPPHGRGAGRNTGCPARTGILSRMKKDGLQEFLELADICCSNSTTYDRIDFNRDCPPPLRRLPLPLSGPTPPGGERRLPPAP